MQKWTYANPVIKLKWEVKIRSIQEEEELSQMWGGSSVIWWSPYYNVKISTVLPTKQDVSGQYQLFDLTLKSPVTTTKKCFFFGTGGLSSFQMSEWVNERVFGQCFVISTSLKTNFLITFFKFNLSTFSLYVLRNIK